MFARTEITQDPFALSAQSRRGLMDHCNRVVALCEKRLRVDFKATKVHVRIVKVAPGYGWSFGGTLRLAQDGIVDLSFYADEAARLAQPAFLLHWANQTLAHESFHVAQAFCGGEGYGRTIGDAFKSEGLAVRFQEELTGRRPWLRWPAPPTAFPAYTFCPMSSVARQTFIAAMEKDFFTPEDKTGKGDRRLFGQQEDATYPRLCGYTFGDWLIGHYLAAHKSTAAQSAALRGKKVINWFLNETPPAIRRGIAEPSAAGYALR